MAMLEWENMASLPYFMVTELSFMLKIYKENMIFTKGKV